MSRRIVITEFMDEDAVESLGSEFEVVYDPELVDRPDDLVAQLADAEALIVRNRTQVTAEVLRAGPNLRVVGRLGVGLDNIDADACRRQGIEVWPAVGANAVAVAEYVIGTMLVLLRGAYYSGERMVAGAWPRTELVGREASGRTLGLVGFGRIAREVATRASALGMAVLAHDPYLPDDDQAWELAERASLSEVLHAADVISIHVPLTEETANLIDADAIERLRPGAVIINTSRGGIVDEPALVDGLRTGRVGGAALDVFASEPLDPAAGGRFAGAPNLVLTPHIAGLTIESQQRVGAVVADAVRRVLRDRG